MRFVANLRDRTIKAFGRHGIQPDAYLLSTHRLSPAALEHAHALRAAGIPVVADNGSKALIDEVIAHFREPAIPGRGISSSMLCSPRWITTRPARQAGWPLRWNWRSDAREDDAMSNPHCQAEWAHYEASRQAFQDAWKEVGKVREKYEEKLTDAEEDDDNEIHPHLCSLEQIANFLSYMEEVHAKEDELVETLDALDAAEQVLQQADHDWLEATTLAGYCEQHWAGKPWVEAAGDE